MPTLRTGLRLNADNPGNGVLFACRFTAKQGKPKGSVLDVHADFILGTLRQTPDLTLAEMVEAACRGAMT